MWPEACAMLERAERLHRQFHHLSPIDERGLSWVPPIDVLETEDQVFVLVGLPGVDPNAVAAVIEGDELVIAGDRSLPDEIGLAIIHRLELPHGRFARRVSLPDGRYSNVQRASAHGCLVVTLDKVL
jgi:HSP20 family protein